MAHQPEDSRTVAKKMLDYYHYHGFFQSDSAARDELAHLDGENTSLRAQVERLQAAPDAARYQTIRRLAQAHSKSGGLTISLNSLKSAASFQFWCSPEELDKYLDELK